MVERYSLSTLEGTEALGVRPAAPRFNIAPLQRAPIRTAAGLVDARWGLLPPWRGHGGKRGPHVLHAPIDQLDATPLLRNAFKSQRCLVLADGFFVWRRAGKKPQPIWIHPGRPVALAGVAATHKDDGVASFALVVGAPSALVAGALAPDPAAGLPFVVAELAAWLAGPRDAALAALAPPDVGWRADPVSTWVNSVDHDDAKCVEPLGNPAQGSLF
jgi:putative SOS response-associated peptidase YedK